mgnify:CR=1 FL=1
MLKGEKPLHEKDPCGSPNGTGMYTDPGCIFCGETGWIWCLIDDHKENCPWVASMKEAGKWPPACEMCIPNELGRTGHSYD